MLVHVLIKDTAISSRLRFHFVPGISVQEYSIQEYFDKTPT